MELDTIPDQIEETILRETEVYLGSMILCSFLRILQDEVGPVALCPGFLKASVWHQGSKARSSELHKGFCVGLGPLGMFQMIYMAECLPGYCCLPGYFS